MTNERYAFLVRQVLMCLPPGDANDVVALMEVVADEGCIDREPLTREQSMALFRAGNEIRSLLFRTRYG